ncbi:GGDEF-domain containing protein [Cupriavidus sp. USMAA2-4]|nr:bifunctional diguanylate cyclase/phosphodiesterase [Cupriavidus sp. USMAA2-4]AOY95300.1 GGDEF-domain containing protein [Cupriavidus sp. USMAA2-4]
MPAMIDSLLLLVIPLCLALGLGLGLGAAGGKRMPGKWGVRYTQWMFLLSACASVGMPSWVVLASGSLLHLGEGQQAAAAAFGVGAAAAAMVQLLRRAPLHWRGTAVVAAALATGLMATAGIELGRACGRPGAMPRACLDAFTPLSPVWLAVGVLMLASVAWLALRGRAHLAAVPPAPGGAADAAAVAPSGDARGLVRRAHGRSPGSLTVRPSAQGEGHVGEYNAAEELPDRAAFARWLEQAIAHARFADTGCAVLLVHIADFREVDEVFEVRADDILAQDTSALAQAVLEPHDFLARLARDEFAVGVPELVSYGRAQELGSRLLGSLGEFVAARGLQMQIGVNIGIAIYPRDAQTSETLMQAARVSLAEARESGSNQVRQFNSAAGERARRVRVIRRDLWPAIEDDALSLEYQPKFDVRQRRVVGAEALCRWRHALLGAVNPAEFIMVAEQSGQIDKLDDWVIAAVCRQVRQWRDLGLPTVPVAINVSGLRFASRNFPQYLMEQIHQHDIPPSAVTLEITETAAMKDIGKSLETLAELQSLGIHVALDDFGSGYSSLGYLKRLRVGTLKIDRTLIGGLDADAQGRAIVGSMVALAHELRMRVVAEGVESTSQLDILAGMGCDEVQGYLLARPLEPGVFAELLRDSEAAAA